MTAEVWESGDVTLYHGDCLDVMRETEADSVDSIVTDPPYGLSFMGKDWDHGIPGVRFWREALRVAKPGAHMLAFGGTRTFHRLAVAIEDAGWEIRDTVMWVYASGFPKSHDVSKAIDKAAGAEREVVHYDRYRDGIDRTPQDKGNSIFDGRNGNFTTAPATPDAERWQGWGTNLKPSFEPVIWATKPLRHVGDCAIIIQNLQQMEAELCEHIANDAAKSLQPTPRGSGGARGDSAPTPAPTQAGAARASETEIGGAGVTGLAADISGSTPGAARIALNTISLWRRTLEGALSLASKCTTEMASSLTTDLKTWSLSLSQVTLESIIQGASHPNGLSAPVSSAAQYFSVVSAKLNAIRELIAQGLVSGESNISPAWEPIIVARKPLSERTIAANVLEHGTGAINVDGCRVEGACDEPNARANKDGATDTRKSGYQGGWGNPGRGWEGTPGRWPANLIHSGEPEVLALFPETKSGNLSAGHGAGNSFGVGNADKKPRPIAANYGGDSGSAARFFKRCPPDPLDDPDARRLVYCPKASKRDRDEGCEGMPTKGGHTACGDYAGTPDHGTNVTAVPRRNGHPCVKPTALMRYLVRLVTPPGGIVLDPFMGSGSTGKAAVLEGFAFVGIDLEAEYVEIAERRIEHAAAQPVLEGIT